MAWIVVGASNGTTTPANHDTAVFVDLVVIGEFFAVTIWSRTAIIFLLGGDSQ
jgi:hypothetical protein